MLNPPDGETVDHRNSCQVFNPVSTIELLGGLFLQLILMSPEISVKEIKRSTKKWLTLKPAENFSEMCVYTIWAPMATLGGVT